MNRRESYGSTMSRRGSSSTNPKVIVPKKRIIVSRTLSDGSSYSKVNNHLNITSLHLLAEKSPNSKAPTTHSPTAPPSIGNDNIYFPPDFYAIQTKRHS